MRRTIWKFPLYVTDAQTIPVPQGAKFLAVQVQAGEPCLWAMVNPDAPKVPVEIRIHGTGHALPDDSTHYDYIGTFQLDSGALVFHVFRVLTSAEVIAAFL